MQAAHGASLARQGVIVLDEISVNSRRPEPRSAVGLAEKAAIVLESLRRDQQHIRYLHRFDFQRHGLPSWLIPGRAPCVTAGRRLPENNLQTDRPLPHSCTGDAHVIPAEKI